MNPEGQPRRRERASSQLQRCHLLTPKGLQLQPSEAMHQHLQRENTFPAVLCFPSRGFATQRGLVPIFGNITRGEKYRPDQGMESNGAGSEAGPGKSSGAKALLKKQLTQRHLKRKRQHKKEIRTIPVGISGESDAGAWK